MGSISPTKRINAATKLRNTIASPGPIILAPGVYDGFSARIALQVGFDTIYMVQKNLYMLRKPETDWYIF